MTQIKTLTTTLALMGCVTLGIAANEGTALAAGVISGTEVANSSACTYGPVAAGLVFAAKHCIDDDGYPEWTRTSIDVAFKSAPGYGNAIATPSGTVPIAGYARPVVGMEIYKSGRTSGLTSGTVSAVTKSGWRSKGMQQCSGDSGSPVYTFINNKAYIIGMVTNGNGSVDENGKVHHDKKCYNTTRPRERYTGGGPSIQTIFESASVSAPVVQQRCNGRDVTQVGTDGDDVIDGTDGDDVILTLGGNDTVHGGDGDDLICGAIGDDRLFGGNGSDRVFGGPGADQLYGQDGSDTVFGGPDGDYLNGGSGNDDLRGEAGNDRLRGTGGDDRLFGGDGDDELNGHGGVDIANGGRGRDACKAERSSACED